MDSLRGTTAWIIGGKRVGQTVAQTLAELGVNLLITYRSSAAEAEATVVAAQKIGVRAVAIQADVTKLAEVEHVVTESERVLGPINHLISMASIFEAVLWDKITEKDWDDNINIHIKGAFWPAQAMAKQWRAEKRPGNIVMITDRTSPDGARPYADHLSYIVTKAATHKMVQVLARELGPHNIRVNAIAPGPLLRPPTIPEAAWQEIRDSALLAGITDEQSVRQVAWAVVYWLTSGLSTGQTLVLDSGLNLF